MSRKKNKYTRWQNSANLNMATFNSWVDYLSDIACSCFTWNNIPDSIDQRFLEMTLMSRGYALWFTDPVLERPLALPCTIGGDWDVYNVPIYRTAFSSNHYHCDRTINNSVIIWNNYMRTNTLDIVELYSLRLTEIERTVDTNVKAQKTPLLITGSENQRLTLQNLYMEYDGNQPVIFGNKDAGLGQLECITTTAPLVAPQLVVLKHEIFNEFLTRMGIENSNQDKKERLVADEVGSNYGSVEMNRRTRLNAREAACEKINRMFGLNISVSFNSNLVTLLNNAFQGVSEANMPAKEPERDEKPETQLGPPKE